MKIPIDYSYIHQRAKGLLNCDDFTPKMVIKNLLASESTSIELSDDQILFLVEVDLGIKITSGDLEFQELNTELPQQDIEFFGGQVTITNTLATGHLFVKYVEITK